MWDRYESCCTCCDWHNNGQKVKEEKKKYIYILHLGEKERKTVIYDVKVVATKKEVDYRGLEKRRCKCVDSMMKGLRKASTSSHGLVFKSLKKQFEFELLSSICCLHTFVPILNDQS